MKKIQELMRVVAWFAILVFSSTWAKADPKEITSDVCTDFKFGDIPLGNFKPPVQMPEATMRVTQGYNNKLEDGSDAYCLIPGSYASWDSDVCKGKKLYYGHDGIDLHEQGASDGQNSVYSAQDGLVVVSHKVGMRTGWGETMIIATRTNEFSDGILTYHYHHLHKTGVPDTVEYTTSRLFNACETVARGEEIAKEGTSGTSAVHLHFSVRRWKNFEELQDALKNDGQGIYGVGYSYGDDAKLAKHLDPYGILYDSYNDFTSDSLPYSWAQSACLNMRHEGIEFGLWDGKFGAEDKVKRREGARWIKIAARRPDVTPPSATFSDVPASDIDAPAIEAMVRYPTLLTVVNPYATCEKGLKKFCPDKNLKRAEAIKMVVLAFYADKFLQVYDNSIWSNAYATALELLSIYMDVDGQSWFAPYVYFGRIMGAVADKVNFRPNDDITRAELAKWINLGISFHKKEESTPCNSVVCPGGSYCDTDDASCKPVSKCVPSETVTCEVGGGYEPTSTGDGGTGGSGGSSGDGGTGGDGGICTGCKPGTIEQKSCSGDGKQSRLCMDDCTWSTWGMCALSCDPGLVNCDWKCVDKKNDNNNCGGCGIKCTGATSCDGGFCKPDGTGGTGGSGGSGGTGGTGGSGGSTSCVDTYTANFSSACYGNPEGTGNPTLCLEVNHISGATFEYRVCKQGGTFTNNFSYQLKDDNYSVFFTTYSGVSGITCSSWKSFSVSYISGYGTVNGAGVEAGIVSPQGCSLSSCKYSTGTVTISKSCK